MSTGRTAAKSKSDGGTFTHFGNSVIFPEQESASRDPRRTLSIRRRPVSTPSGSLSTMELPCMKAHFTREVGTLRGSRMVPGDGG